MSYSFESKTIMLYIQLIPETRCLCSTIVTLVICSCTVRCCLYIKDEDLATTRQYMTCYLNELSDVEFKCMIWVKSDELRSNDCPIQDKNVIQLMQILWGDGGSRITYKFLIYACDDMLKGRKTNLIES